MVGDGEAYTDTGGYSILEAESEQAIVDLLREHPHFHTPGGQIEVRAMLRMPGT